MKPIPRSSLRKSAMGFFARFAWTSWLALGVYGLALPWVHEGFTLHFANSILVFSLFALSLNLLVGFAGMVSLGHAAFFGLGAYATALLAEHGVTGAWAMLPLTVLVCGVAALVIGWLSLGTSGVGFLMITLALAQLLYFVALNADWAGSTDGMILSSRPLLPGVDLNQPEAYYYYTLALVAGSALILRRLVASPFGRVVQGIRVNEHRMASLGFATRHYKLLAFLISGVFAGLAGHLFVGLQNFIDPTTLSWQASGQVLIMVVLGGTASFYGPVLGALIFITLEEWISSYTEHWMLPLGLFLVAVVLFGRGGLAGLIMTLWNRVMPRLTPHPMDGAPQPGEPAPDTATMAREAFKEAPPGTPLLETRNLSRSYGGSLLANNRISLSVATGEAHAVIGPNGAGKTTLINQIAGHLSPDQGEILLRGVNIQGKPPYAITGMGVGRTFQKTNILGEFSVLENVRLAVQAHMLGATSLRKLWRGALAQSRVITRAEALLRQSGLAERRLETADALSHGEKRQLELAMALASQPRLLLLDEPMAGMSVEESRRITDLLISLKQTHTLLLIEHDMDAVFAIADRITVLVYGEVVATDTPEAIRNNPEVREAYLGEGEYPGDDKAGSKGENGA